MEKIPQKQQNGQKERPINIRVGSVRAAIWKNGYDGRTYYTVKIDRVYREKGGRWEHTNSLKMNDIPKAILALQKAYEYMAVRGQTGFELSM